MLQTIKRIRIIIEEVKFELTLEDEGIFFYDNLCGLKNFELIITRNKFEELCMDLWKKCFERVEDAIFIADLKKKDINEIILVGGSTRIPKIRQMVEDFFGKEPLRNIDPDEVVAYGATLSIHKKLKLKEFDNKEIEEIMNSNQLLKEEIEKLKKENEMLLNDLNIKDANIKDLENDLKTKNNNLKMKDEKIKHLENNLSVKNDNLNMKDGKIKGLENESNIKDGIIKELEKKLKRMNHEYDKINKKLITVIEKNKNLENQIN